MLQSASKGQIPDRGGRQHVEHRHPGHLRGMIEREAVRDATPAVVSRNREASEPELPHESHEIERHRPLCLAAAECSEVDHVDEPPPVKRVHEDVHKLLELGLVGTRRRRSVSVRNCLR